MYLAGAILEGSNEIRRGRPRALWIRKGRMRQMRWLKPELQKLYKSVRDSEPYWEEKGMSEKTLPQPLKNEFKQVNGWV